MCLTAAVNSAVAMFGADADGQQRTPPSEPKSAFPRLAATAFHRAVRLLKVSCCPHFDVTGGISIAGSDLCPQPFSLSRDPHGLCFFVPRSGLRLPQYQLSG